MTSSLLLIVYFAAFSHALFLAVSLVRKSGAEAPGRLLAIVIGLLAYSLFEGGVIHGGLYPVMPHAVGWLPMMVLFLGPVFFQYVRRMTGQSVWDLRTWALNLLPAIVVWLYYAPFLFRSAAQKRAADEAAQASTTEYVMPMGTIMLFLAVKLHLASYLYASWRELDRFAVTIDDLRADDSGAVLRQIRLLAAALILLEAVWVVLFVAKQFFGLGALDHVSQIWLLFIAGIVMAMGYLGLHVSRFLVSREERSLAETRLAAPAAVALDEPATVKYLHSALPESAAGEVAEMIDHALLEDQLYLDEKLTLTRLAARIDIKAHTVSQVINQHMGTNFYKLVNRYRIQHACALIEDPACHLSLERIAMESGFSNRVTFNKAFKEEHGCTARDYRAKQGAAKRSG